MTELTEDEKRIVDAFMIQLEGYCVTSGSGVPRAIAQQRKAFHRTAKLALEGTLLAGQHRGRG